MFNSQKKMYNVFTYSTSKNEWNEDIKSPVFCKYITMFISLKSYNDFTSNDIRLQEVTHIGITEDKTLQKGMIIGDKYTIEFINNDGRESIVYLKQVV